MAENSTICYENPKFPQEIKGKSILNIYHRKDGSLSEFRILRDMVMERRSNCVIKLSPHWIPGTVDNKPVRVEYSLPITIQTD
jgi:hypothetical protein